MIRVIGKYLKKFWVGVLCIVALLYGQAQCELALPDYMSNIVSTGIQSSGIEYSVPEVVSKSTMERAQIFMSDAEKTRVQEAFLYTQDRAQLPFSIHKKTLQEGVYVLRDSARVDDVKLNAIFTSTLMVVSSLEASSKEGASIDPFMALQAAPAVELKKIRNEVQEKINLLGESSVKIAGTQVLKVEYDRIGVNTSTIQNAYVWGVGMKMLTIALGGVLCAIIVGLFSGRIAAGVARDMRKDTFNTVESFSNTEFNSFSTASLITRTTNDIQQIQMALVMGLRFMIYSPLMGVGAVIRVMDSKGSMIWIIAATVIVLMIVIIGLMTVVGPKFKAMQKLVDRLNLVMREQLSGMLVIRAFHNEEEESARFEKANRATRNTQLFTGRSMALMMPIIMFIMNATSLLIIWVGSHEIDLGTLQVGDMMAYMQYAMQIIMSFMFIAMMSIILPRAGTAAKRIFEVLDTPLSIADPRVTKETSGMGNVRFNNVSFRYPGAEEDVLEGISFEAKPGETTAFIGSTGSGKSTIINLVPRFFDVSGGSVEVNGVDIRDINQHELRDKIGLVPQKGQLFAGTIASNIKYSDENMSDERMIEAARIAQATEFISTKEEGYQSPISQGGSNVSGGQKQRLSIARAVAKQPEIFIFDDSFSALDFKTDALLREALNKLCAHTKSTMLVVAQRISSIMHAQQIIVLEEGKMVGKGTHEELMEVCSVYQEIAHSQLSKEELENE